jgi:hypothetical protein
MWQAALITIVLSMIPVPGDFKMHLSLLLTALLANRTFVIYIKDWFKINKSQHLVIRSLEGRGYGRINPIYHQFQKYIAEKLIGQLSYEVTSQNGKTLFMPYNTVLPLKDTYLGHEITISVNKHRESGSSWSNDEETIYTLQSNTANREQIEQYVRGIMDIEFEVNHNIDIYQPSIIKRSDIETVTWKRKSIVTNKTLENTFYAASIIKQLFDDIHHFANNEPLYMKRGIPYKRGYILYGPPGSGKTCISKIVANKYNIPIFYLDLTTISKNESLIDLVDEISVYACGKKYILLMEDVERSGFFAKDEKTETKLTMDCLLNVLDGVVEPHNRITIMTVNDKSKIVGHEALIRPGRIDKIIEIGYCDSTQIENMFHLFFPNSKIKQTSYKLKNNITPAIVMKFLQESEQPQQFFAMLKNH